MGYKERPKVACSKRSDSREWRGVKKARKSRGRTRKSVVGTPVGLSFLYLPSLVFIFFAPILVRSLLSERPEQARPKDKESRKMDARIPLNNVLST